MRLRRLRVLTLLVAVAMTAVSLWPAGADAATYPKTPNDTDFVRQWGLRRINAPAAWATATGKGIVVADIDTGVNTRHPDLIGHFVKGYDFYANDANPSDAEGHGTSTSGVITATTNNKMGVAGTAPDAKIMPLRACSRTGGAECDSQAVADAIMYAADHGAQVINLSLGGLPWPAEEAAVLYATALGSLVVASAGNSSDPFCAFPAANPTALCVGATDGLDRPAGFTSYGLRLDVMAPGVAIRTTDRTGYYSSPSGTSFSAPFVSGVGALLMSMGASNVLAGIIIRKTARDAGLPGYDITYGFGIVDAKAAVDMCKQIC